MNEFPLAKKSKVKRDDIPIISPLSPTAIALAATNSSSPRAQSAISARKPGVGAHLEPLFHHLPPTPPITANTAATARLTRRVSSGDKDSLMSSPSETIISWMNINAPNIITEWLNHHTDTIIRAAVNQLLTSTSTSTQPNLQQQILTQLQTLVASQAQNKAFHKVSKHGNTRKPSIDNLSSSGVSSAGDDDDVEVKGSDDDDQDDDVDDEDADMSTSETSNIHMGFKSRTSIHANTTQEDGVDFPNVEDPRDAIKKKMMKKFDTHDVESQPIRTPAFPQKKSPQPQATRRPVGMAGAKSSVGSGGFDLLLVEDVRVSQRIAHHALTRAHYKVDVASDGETAVEKFKQHMSSLRIVLMDINLPGISGIEATEQIRKHERDHRVTNPVLVFGLTGNVDEDSLRSYEQVGMNGCILKGKLLVESVREAVDAASRSSEFVNLCGEGNKRRAGYTSGSENDSGDDRGSPQQPKRAIPLTQQIAMKQTQQKIKPEYDIKQSTDVIPMEDTTPIPTPKRVTPTSTSTSTSSNAIPVHIPGSTSGPDVLLVEDVRVSQRIAHQALTRAHYKVEVASDGETAVEKFRTYQSTLRIILMDINLPGISGIEATEQIRKMERAVGVTNPVLVFGLTGNVDQDNLRTYEEVGMNGCILKGKLLVDAVKQATLEYSKTPGTFVDLASKPHEIPKTEQPKLKKKLGLGLRSAGAAQASLIQQATPSTSTTTTTTTISPEEDADDDEEMVVERDEAAKLEAQSKREAELSGRIAATRAQALKREGQGVAIGTPRASQPRQLLASKFAGAGKVKPGVGLPSATTTTTTSSTSSERPLGLQRGSSKSSNGPDCLLVEDVRVSQRIAQQALTRAHYKVDVASDGETSVEKFKQHMDTLRIVLMDINLPGISGIEATERIRKHERDQKITNPVLVFGLTGNVDEDSLRSYEQVGMNGCILKGKLLVDSVKKATEEAARNPTKFVNLVGDSDPSASP